MDLYKRNINFLNKKLKNIVSQIKISRKFKILETRSNDITVKLLGDNKKFLHSSYNPKKEAKRFINSYNIDEYDNILLVGFGFGYHVREILNKLGEDQRLKVIISSPDIFKLALKHRKLDYILSDDRVEIILKLTPILFVQRLKRLFTGTSYNNTKLIIHNQSLEMIPDEFIFLKDILEEIKISRFNNKRINNIITDNILKNINYVNESIGVKNFRAAFSNYPVFIISAGPSLDKNIHELKKIGDKGIIIAVDTSVNPLLKVGIRPDFVVTIESINEGYSRIFQKVPQLDIPLVYSLGVNYQIIGNYKGEKILGLAKGDLIMDKIEEVINKGRLSTGGSVASAALDFGVQLGGNPVIFVGQDFAFSKEGITHASNTMYKDEKYNLSILEKIEGVNEKVVYTSKNYYLYLRYFEKYISNNKSVKFIDATEGGAKISGTDIMTLQNAIKLYCKKIIDKEKIIFNIFKNYSLNNNYSIKDIEEIIQKKV